MANYGAEKKYIRPAIAAFCAEPPVLSGTDLTGDFKYLTDDNRSPIEISPERIEYRQRMINGRMRSYHIADKNTYSLDWSSIPSRAINPNTTSLDFISERYYNGSTEVNPNYLAADDMLEWYEDHTGEFYLILCYDRVHAMGTGNDRYQKLTRASEVVPVFFQDFSYSVIKRGQYNDLWSVSMSLVEA